jgi:hypothetical protein
MRNKLNRHGLHCFFWGKLAFAIGQRSLPNKKQVKVLRFALFLLGQTSFCEGAE